MPGHPTLIRPPPPSTSKSAIEDVLELTQLSDIEPNLFTNTRPLWHPPGARGIYGGAAIAQCLAAAQRTVPENYTVHSMHCYFVLNGNSEIPIIYHVENVREGRSFCTRTVQARQRGQPIFTTTLSFMREGAGGKKQIQHAHPMPPGVVPKEIDEEDLYRGNNSPFFTQRIDIMNDDSPELHNKKPRHWIKARGTISEAGGHQAHLSALAYMSDSYFIGTVARVHKLWRYRTDNAQLGSKIGKFSISPSTIRKLKSMPEDQLKRVEGMDEDVIAQLRALDVNEKDEIVFTEQKRPEIGMMVSLDHSIYFHNPRNFRADEWLYTECESPWSGDGRGLVLQRMYTKEGILVASCVQEVCFLLFFFFCLDLWAVSWLAD